MLKPCSHSSCPPSMSSTFRSKVLKHVCDPIKIWGCPMDLGAIVMPCGGTAGASVTYTQNPSNYSRVRAPSSIHARSHPTRSARFFLCPSVNCGSGGPTVHVSTRS